MKRRRYFNDPPPPGAGVSYQHIEMTESISHYPITGKVTRLKWDRGSGTLIVDPDQPKDETPTPADPESGEMQPSPQ